MLYTDSSSERSHLDITQVEPISLQTHRNVLHSGLDDGGLLIVAEKENLPLVPNIIWMAENRNTNRIITSTTHSGPCFVIPLGPAEIDLVDEGRSIAFSANPETINAQGFFIPEGTNFRYILHPGGSLVQACESIRPEDEALYKSRQRIIDETSLGKVFRFSSITTANGATESVIVMSGLTGDTEIKRLFIIQNLNKDKYIVRGNHSHIAFKDHIMTTGPAAITTYDGYTEITHQVEAGNGKAFEIGPLIWHVAMLGPGGFMVVASTGEFNPDNFLRMTKEEFREHITRI